jgi:hypothetical protein
MRGAGALWMLTQADRSAGAWHLDRPRPRVLGQELGRTIGLRIAENIDHFGFVLPNYNFQLYDEFMQF